MGYSLLNNLLDYDSNTRYNCVSSTSMFNVEMLKVDTGYTSCTSSLFNVRSDCNDCSVNSEAGGCLSKVTQVPENHLF